MPDPEALRLAVLESLAKVIDPETGADVVRMRLIEDLVIGPDGQVSYTIRPSSPLCPVAVFLAIQVKMAVANTPGVTTQKITVTNYIASEQLTEMINQDNIFG
jgi:ATP-binding protein involved in chromosome partitioning